MTARPKVGKVTVKSYSVSGWRATLLAGLVAFGFFLLGVLVGTLW